MKPYTFLRLQLLYTFRGTDTALNKQGGQHFQRKSTAEVEGKYRFNEIEEEMKSTFTDSTELLVETGWDKKVGLTVQRLRQLSWIMIVLPGVITEENWYFPARYISDTTR